MSTSKWIFIDIKQETVYCYAKILALVIKNNGEIKIYLSWNNKKKLNINIESNCRYMGNIGQNPWKKQNIINIVIKSDMIVIA